jgi:hypothetical protein
MQVDCKANGHEFRFSLDASRQGGRMFSFASSVPAHADISVKELGSNQGSAGPLRCSMIEVRGNGKRNLMVTPARMQVRLQ